MVKDIYEVPGLLVRLMDTYTLADMDGMIDDGVLKKIRNVILTGCGEERYAAEAVKPVYENKKNFKGTGMFPGVEVYPMSQVDFSRYYCTYRGWHPQRKDKHLVVVADQEGKSEYSVECVERARSFGSPAVAVTVNQDSGLTDAADYKLFLDGKGNAACTYSAQVYLMTLLGLKLSKAKGFLTARQTEEIWRKLRSYVTEFKEVQLVDMDEAVRDIGNKWKDKGINMVQFTGSAQDQAVAGWGSIMFMRETGLPTSLDDLEGWCHVDIFTAPNDRIGCVVVINSRSMAMSRANEVIQVMRSLGREVMVVTDAPIQENYGADIVRLPGCGYEFGAPLLQQLPMALLAEYMK